MNQEKYNGYTNRATWLVSAWIANEESLGNMAKDVIVNAPKFKVRKDDALKAAIDEIVNVDTVGLQEDLMNEALNHVNWQEIVEVIEED